MIKRRSANGTARRLGTMKEREGRTRRRVGNSVKTEGGALAIWATGTKSWEI